MSTLTSLSRFLTSTHRHPSGGNQLIHPERDWLVGLVCAVLLFVSGAAYLGYDFLTQYRGVDEQRVVDETVVRYRAADAALHLSTYRERELSFRSLRADRTHADVLPVIEEVVVESEVAAEAESAPLAEEGVGQ